MTPERPGWCVCCSGQAGQECETEMKVKKIPYQTMKIEYSISDEWIRLIASQTGGTFEDGKKKVENLFSGGGDRAVVEFIKSIRN